MADTTVSIVVDGVTYEVRKGSNLLHACLSQGLDLPYFCWHPSLGSVGACRQCAVVQYKDEADEKGKLTMACMTPAADGARLSIRADEALKFRESVIEWLMLNHPHDCPVCEEGGECHLQDMTVMTGHTFRRYRGNKRTFRNQYLGPFINHEMNRCITCYRCVRFYRDYAGASDLDAFGSRDRLFFGRAEDGVLESEFAGNLVEVCPTGVFTDKPFSATYTRKWDLTSAPSVCHGCGLGCNTLPGERYGRVKRVHNRYHGEVNGYFLCDRGRFGVTFVNDPARLRQAGVRRDDGSFDPVAADEAVRRGADGVSGGRVAGIGSPRASLEANFVLQHLVGADAFCAGFAEHEAAVMDAVVAVLGMQDVRVPTLREIESADAVLVLGEDVSNTAPRLALALRQTVRNRSFELASGAGIPLWQDAGVRGHAGHLLTPLLQATALPTRLHDVTQHSLFGASDTLARVGLAMAAALGASGFPAPQLDGEDQAFVDTAARVLAEAERPLVISGTGAGSAAVVRAAGAVAAALAARGKTPSVCLSVPECNSLGVRLLGGRRRLDDVLDAAQNGEVDTLIVLENELSLRTGRTRLESLPSSVNVIVLDTLEGFTPEHASLVLPAAPFTEADGTWVNHEGRVQRHYRVLPPADQVAPSWLWLVRMAQAAGRDMARRFDGFEHVNDVLEALGRERPELAGLAAAALEAAGVTDGARLLPPGVRVPRQPHRYSGRTAMNANVSVHEPKPPRDDEAPLSFSMEGALPRDPGGLLPYVWAPGWNSNQSVFKFQAEVGGALRGGPDGVRLPRAVIEGAAGSPAPLEAPPPFAPGEGFLMVPLHDVFGSDERSARSPAVAQRMPVPYAAVSPTDAERLGLTARQGVRVSNGASGESFAVRIEPAMAPGGVGLVRGMTGRLWAEPGSRLQVRPDPDYVPPAAAPADGVIARG